MFQSETYLNVDGFETHHNKLVIVLKMLHADFQLNRHLYFIFQSKMH